METTLVYWGYIGIMEKNGNCLRKLGISRDSGEEREH